MRLLVCGGRDYAGDIGNALDMLPSKPSIVIHGGARGADRRAGEWAIGNGIHVAVVPALWDYYGRYRAGGQRNQAMLALQPEYCVAFPGGRGTAHMVKLCAQFNIPVWKPYG